MSEDDSTLEDLLVQHAFGEPLAPAERARLEAALAQDPALRAELDSLTRTMRHLATGVQRTPPASLRDRVLASAAPAPLPVSRAARSSAARWPQALAAGIAVIALGISIFLAMENQRLRRDSAQQNAAARMLLEPNVVKSFKLAGSGAGADATGVVILDLDAKRASIAVSGLTTLPAGQSYTLWAELQDKRVPCGDFQIMPDGTLLTQFQIPVDSYTSPILRMVLTATSGDVVLASG